MTAATGMALRLHDQQPPSPPETRVLSPRGVDGHPPETGGLAPARDTTANVDRAVALLLDGSVAKGVPHWLHSYKSLDLSGKDQVKGTRNHPSGIRSFREGHVISGVGQGTPQPHFRPRRLGPWRRRMFSEALPAHEALLRARPPALA